MEGGITLPFSSTSVAEIPASCCSDEVAGAGKSSSTAAGVSADLMDLQRRQILRELQVTVDRYNDSFRSLSLMLADLELLRQENLALRAENLEFSLFLEEERNNVLAANPESCGVLDPRSTVPQIGMDENLPPGDGIIPRNEKTGVLGVVPKSISIRSKGFLAVDHASGRSGGTAEDVSASGNQVGEADGMGISVEVFNQGMAKTELCNKWEEMGWCPYGDQCQFAHGVDELRPVIRHPRYKTQLCRMIGGPGGCPYGHRCHFRHAHLHTQNSQ
ncbi:unnamed protein product [Spirodela intermedia]|uniref:C3H1-type domain-containing protein n=1 Tax=Spirodela intermedia TaxID=51605 RepID=A0A7I8JZR3_SPIIN|nr:unnamed protein product [Spirodela intermedia]